MNTTSTRAKDTPWIILGIILFTVTGYLFITTQGAPLPSFQTPTAETVER